MAPQPIPGSAPAPQLEVVNAIEELRRSVQEIAAAPRMPQPIGESYVTVPIGQAIPKPPDVAVEGKVPGGVLVPCTPVFAAGQGVVVNRNEALVQFPFPQGFRLQLTRIHVNVPVWLEEAELEKQVFTSKFVQTFTAEAEAVEAMKNQPASIGSEEFKPISYSSPFEQINNTETRVRAAEKITIKEEKVTFRSVLPITPVILLRLKGPDGELWSGSFEPPMHFVEGAAGAAFGTGFIDAYADLQNSISLNNSRVYSLQLSIFVPTTVKTNAQIGPEGKVGASGKGAITIFYDVDSAAVGK